MKVGLPWEMIYMEWVAELKSVMEKTSPGVEWVHRPSGRGPEPLFLEGDACLPFKKMVRTSMALLRDVDALLLPRITSLDGYLMCPNFRALPDIVELNRKKCGIADLARIVSPLMEISGPADLTAAAASALGELGLGQSTARGSTSLEPIYGESTTVRGPDDLSRTIALIGHPYMLQDPGLNNNVPGILRAKGFDTVLVQQIPFPELDRLAGSRDYYAKKLYWKPGREILGGFLYFTRVNRPAGIIQPIAFNCGVEALLRIEIMSLYKRMDNPPPYMVLVCDEHTQRDHVLTRLEAFLDIIDGIGIE